MALSLVDILIVLGRFGNSNCGRDSNCNGADNSGYGGTRDGKVTVEDLLQVLSQFGRNC